MPVIFASTLLSLPSGLARSQPWLQPVAAQLGPTGALFLPVRARLESWLQECAKTRACLQATCGRGMFALIAQQLLKWSCMPCDSTASCIPHACMTGA